MRALLQVLEAGWVAAKRQLNSDKWARSSVTSVLVLVAMRQQKRAAPVGSPSLDRSLLALYQGVALSARESVLPCANARAATAGVPVRMTGAWLQAVWMEALFIVRHLPRGGDGCESSGSTCRVQGSRVTFL